MQIDDHQDNSLDSSKNSRPNSPGREEASPKFLNPSQSNPSYPIPFNSASPPPPFSYTQSPIFGSYQPPPSQTFTSSQPPISTSSGMPQINMRNIIGLHNAQPMQYFGPPINLPPGVNIPGGVIVGPPTSLPPGIPSNIPLNYRQQHFQPPPPTTITNYEMVSRAQFQKCAEQCHIWSVKYKQLNTKYNNLLKQKGTNESIDSNFLKLREQNYHLEQRIQAYQAAERQLAGNIQVYITDLINKYKEQTLRQTSQLFERFKLECRSHERQ